MAGMALMVFTEMRRWTVGGGGLKQSAERRIIVPQLRRTDDARIGRFVFGWGKQSEESHKTRSDAVSSIQIE